tara:strand:+ start:1125 stop:1454 length:330 start_codon:yes stop_codon:yes gene_type:complete
MIIREFAAKSHKQGKLTRVWLEESKNNTWLSDHGFIRGEKYKLIQGDDSLTILLDCEGSKIVSGKDTRSLFDITKKRENHVPCFYPDVPKTLIATIEVGKIVITCKEEN